MICVHDTLPTGKTLAAPWSHLVTPNEAGETVRCPDGRAPTADN